MKINIRVNTNSRKQEVIKEDSFYRVKLLSAPEKGEANKELIKLLSNHFHLPKNRIKIWRGLKSPDKVIEIENKKGRI